MNRLVLEVENLRVAFGGFTAIESIDYRAYSGQIQAIIGPNGAGKTTFVNAVSGVVSHGGVVRVDGRQLKGPPSTRSRRGVARSFQHTEIFPALTPREHLLVCRPMRDGDRRLSELAEAILSEVTPAVGADLGLYDRRLLELARAAAMRPRLLLLDEPVSGLDASERARVGELLRMFTGFNVAVVLIEHDMRVVHWLSHTVTVMDRGEVVAEGPPELLAQDEAVVRAYIEGV